ncbi:MAG: hypothetical protein WCH98_15145, partial [Verrucomicrobiota bacterium]
MNSQIATHQAVPFSVPEKQATLHAHIAERSVHLEQLAAELKAELFGIDEVIDRVVESMRAWYVLPDLIN